MGEFSTEPPPPAAAHRPLRRRSLPGRLARAVPAAFVLGLTAGGACYWAAGASLGLFFGAFAFAAILTPPSVLAEERWPERLAAAGALWAGLLPAWLAAGFASETRAGEWLQCATLLLAFVAALAGFAGLLARGVGRLTASALAVGLALAWLSWPVWLSPWLRGPAGERLVEWIAPAHPLLAANGALPHLGVWTEAPLVYKATVLNQDVSYTLPANVLRAVVGHGLIAVIAFAATQFPDRARRRA